MSSLARASELRLLANEWIFVDGGMANTRVGFFLFTDVAWPKIVRSQEEYHLCVPNCETAVESRKASRWLLP
jgi:hypothetical protein